MEMRAVPIRNKDGLYAIRGRAATATGEAAAAMATWRDVTPAQLDAYKKWHARMGDAHPEKMKLMAEHTQGTPLQTVPVTAAARAAGVCPHCARGKMRRGHVGACKHRPTKLMEQTQIDWCMGPVLGEISSWWIHIRGGCGRRGDWVGASIPQENTHVCRRNRCADTLTCSPGVKFAYGDRLAKAAYDMVVASAPPESARHGD